MSKELRQTALNILTFSGSISTTIMLHSMFGTHFPYSLLLALYIPSQIQLQMDFCFSNFLFHLDTFFLRSSVSASCSCTCPFHAWFLSEDTFSSMLPKLYFLLISNSISSVCLVSLSGDPELHHLSHCSQGCHRIFTFLQVLPCL